MLHSGGDYHLDRRYPVANLQLHYWLHPHCKTAPFDVPTTVNKLTEQGVRVHCLALGGVDLTSPAGKMTMGVIAAVAQFEKDLRIEHTLAGQARAKAEGKKFGRRAALTAEGREKALQRLAGGASISAVAREMNASSLSDSDFRPT